MDSQYGIAVTNKFCLFDDDDEVDPYEILKQEEAKRVEALAKEKTDKSKAVKKPKKSAPQPDKSKLSEQNTQKREEKTVSQSQSRPQQNDRPPRSARMNRENREPREDRRPRRFEENTFNAPASNESRDKPEGGFGGRMEGRGGFSGRSRGRGGPRGRGRGGGFGGGFGGKREFERHSGSDRTSGVKSMEKREGGGSHNWGTFKDDMDEEGSKENEKPEDWNQGGEDAENQDPNESTESTEQPVPEGEKAPKQLTFDEWKAQEEKKRMKADFNLRKPNEGSDTAQWNKGYVYKKPANESDEEEDDDEEYEEEDEHKSKSQVPIRITFNDSPRRGGRGGGRGSRPPRGGRGPRGMPGRGDRRGGPRDSAPRFDDEADFPSLVKSAA